MKTIRIGLDDLLREQGITRYELSKRTAIKFQTIDNYYKNKAIRYDSETLLKMCTELGCGIEELIQIRDDQATR